MHILVKKSFLQNKGSFFKFKTFKNFCLFIYFWLPWVSVTAHRLSLVAASRGYSLVVVASLAVEHQL